MSLPLSAALACGDAEPSRECQQLDCYEGVMISVKGPREWSAGGYTVVVEADVTHATCEVTIDGDGGRAACESDLDVEVHLFGRSIESIELRETPVRFAVTISRGEARVGTVSGEPVYVRESCGCGHVLRTQATLEAYP